MTKKEIIASLEKYNDDDELNVEESEWSDLMIVDDKKIEAYKVYQEIIDAIADYNHFDYHSVCEAANLSTLSWIESYGYVDVMPVIENNKLYYKIFEEYTKNDHRLYTGLFSEECGYYIHSVIQFEDDEPGQILLPLAEQWLCIAYHS